MMASTGDHFTFRLERDDDIVHRFLNTAERGRVVQWQPANTDWSIELHGGHLTGEPFYIRLDGNDDRSNVPKVDTLGLTAAHYNGMGNIANYQKLRVDLSETQIDALLLFIRQNWNTLSLIAHRYANRLTAPPDPPQPTAQPTTKKCTTPRCTGTVPIYPNGGKKAACSVCYKYQ
jgi:hypothetical protein